MLEFATVMMVLTANPTAVAPTSQAELVRNAQRIVAADAPATGPGIAAVIGEGGRVRFLGASGKADASGRMLRPDDLFRYASITKQFTAALVLTLVDEERLSLDDRLGGLLPTQTPAAWHAVTVRQLLNHTSGIPSYTNKPAFAAIMAKPITTQGLIDLTRGDPLEFPPGTKFAYNNSGYVLLSAIVEQKTGKPWFAALRERVTGPLGLRSIRCGCEPGPAVVTGFTEGNEPAPPIDMSVPSGAGALVGNVADLARWAAALHGGKLLKPASYQAMITPALPTGATEHYGFGLGRGDVRGVATIGHSGGINGFNSESLYASDRKLFVAVLSNDDSREPGSSVSARRLLAMAAGVPLPVMTVQPADLAALAPSFGVYRFGDTERQFFARDGKLFTRRTGGGPQQVFAAGQGRFFYGPNSLSYFDLGTGAGGVPSISFHANGALTGTAGTRTGPNPPEAAALVVPPAVLDLLVGSYAGSLGTITIARQGEGLTGQLTGQAPIPLEAIGPREFRTIGVDARLLFEESEGKVVRIVLHQGGRTMPFERR